MKHSILVLLLFAMFWQPYTYANNRKETFVHTVSSGETLYGVSKMYNVTIEEITNLNPAAQIGIIKPGQQLIIPQQQVQTSSQTTFIYHTIRPKETLFSLARTYGTTIEAIVVDNPGLSPANFSIGKVVRIAQVEVPDTATDIPVTNEEPAYTLEIHYDTHKVKRRETFSSIARDYDVTVKQLQNSNPSVERLRIGDEIFIPVYTKKLKEVEIEVIDSAKLISQLFDDLFTPQKEAEIEVALLLPFMLNDSNNQTSHIYTEFYEGFLLAVKAFKEKGLSINVYAFDTEGSRSQVERILSQPDMAKVDLIVAPEDDQLITLVANYALAHGINMVNAFSLKNEESVHNARIFQTNIPHSYLYAETAQEFVDRFSDQQIVFLRGQDMGNDKQEFLEILKHDLTQKSVPYIDYTYTETTELIELDSLLQLNGKVMFVPESGSKATLDKVILPLTQLVAKEGQDSVQVSLFGYPEWQVYTSEYINNFYMLNTYIYSRFYANPLQQTTKNFYNDFKYWYSKDLIWASPRYGILGYDTGYYFLNALSKYGRNFEAHIDKMSSNGIQTDFYFERMNNWSGFINKNIYFVNFMPNYRIEKHKIQ